MMNRYEMIYIIDTGLEEAARKELIEKVSALVTANGGEIEKVDETWGKRRLAYAIDYKTEGWYVLVNFKAPAELPRELERNLQINENVLRYLVVKLEEKRSAVKPRPVRPAAPAEEAAPPRKKPRPPLRKRPRRMPLPPTLNKREKGGFEDEQTDHYRKPDP